MPVTVNIYNNTGEGFKTENPYLNAVNNIKNGQNITRKETQPLYTKRLYVN